MSGKHQAPDHLTTRQRLLRLIAGTLIFLLVVVPTYFVSLNPEWITWLIRGFGGLWLIDCWRRHLDGILERKRECHDRSNKTQ